MSIFCALDFAKVCDTACWCKSDPLQSIIPIIDETDTCSVLDFFTHFILNNILYDSCRVLPYQHETQCYTLYNSISRNRHLQCYILSLSHIFPLELVLHTKFASPSIRPILSPYTKLRKQKGKPLGACKLS